MYEGGSVVYLETQRGGFHKNSPPPQKQKRSNSFDKIECKSLISKQPSIDLTKPTAFCAIQNNSRMHLELQVKNLTDIVLLIGRCMHRASSYNMYINQQDAQNSCD